MPAEALNLLGALGIGGALFLVVLFVRDTADAVASGLDPARRDYMREVSSEILGLSLQLDELIAVTVMVVIAITIVTMLVGGPVWFIAIILAGAIAAPFMIYQSRLDARRKALEEALPSALQQIANEMGTGRSLERAVLAASESAASPVDVELELLYGKLQVMSVEDALTQTEERLRSESFSLTSAVIKVGTQQGGNLIRALKHLSETLVEIGKLRKKIDTASESGRRAIRILAILGFAVPSLNFGLQPAALERALTNSLGVTLLSLSFVCYVAALVMAVYVARVKV